LQARHEEMKGISLSASIGEMAAQPSMQWPAACGEMAPVINKESWL